MISEAILRRGPTPLEGPIMPGEVFAWEPDLPYARELFIVRRTYQRGDEPWVESWDMNYTATSHTDEERFREAAVRTGFQRFPAERPPLMNMLMPTNLSLGKEDLCE